MRKVTWAILLAATVRGQSLAPGLLATYRDRNHSVTLVVPTPNFHLGPQESVHPSLAAAFDAEWTGLISILQSGSYTFKCAGCEVSMGQGRPVQLDSGRHPIRIRYRRDPGPATLRLQWQSNHFPLEPVPSSVLWHTSPTPDDRAERGRYLVEEFGCVNCHATRSPSLNRRFGPHLIGIGSRTTAAWIYRWLEDPSALLGDAAMPAMLEEQQRRDVAAYLASLKASDGFAATRQPRRQDVSQGKQLFGSLGCAACHQQKGLALDGIGSKWASAALIAYLKDPAKVDPGGRMPSLMLSDTEAFQLAAFLMESKKAVFAQPVSGGDPARGKALVRSQGCLNCHALAEANAFAAPPRLEKLSPDRGCLADEPGARLPRYRLSGEQRGAIQAFLREFQQRPDTSLAPVYDLYRSLQRLRCDACHEIDNQRPATAVDEATPPLTDLGSKLRTRWIEQVLLERKRVRTSLKLRMPHYDPGQARSLIEGFAKASGVEPGDGPAAPPFTSAQRNRGVAMVGTNAQKGGMGCIGCHDWGGHKSLGEEGPQLINITDRLRYDWYQRWMLDPARILSGTSMPNYFTSVPREQAEETTRTLWAALAMGPKMPLPEGFAEGKPGEEEQPVPDREPIVVRWDMPEATPAAIAVGLPGKISYCFDAGESRLRYAWEGGFIDLSGTLLRKVDENRITPTAQIMGKIFYRSEQCPLRVGAPDRIPQRRFRGYRLIKGYPEFHYQADGIDVYERIVAVKGKVGIAREFTIENATQPMWFVDEKSGQAQPIPSGPQAHFEVVQLRGDR